MGVLMPLKKTKAKLTKTASAVKPVRSKLKMKW